MDGFDDLDLLCSGRAAIRTDFLCVLSVENGVGHDSRIARNVKSNSVCVLRPRRINSVPKQG